MFALASDYSCSKEKPRHFCVDQGVSSEERRHGASSFNAMFGAWLAARILPRHSLHKLSLQAFQDTSPIVFAPEGSPLDRD